MPPRRRLLPAVSLLLCLTTCAFAVRSRFALDAFHLRAGTEELFLDISQGHALLEVAAHVPARLRSHRPFHTTFHAQSPIRILGSNPTLTPHQFLGQYFARFTDPPTGITPYFYLFPLWHLIALTALLPLYRAYRLWRNHRPRPPHACPNCGYDCRATPDRCPECGSPLLGTSTTCERLEPPGPAPGNRPD